MEPETFVNLLLDHIESKAVISTEYNYLSLHNWEVTPEIAVRLPRFAQTFYYLKMPFSIIILMLII